MRGTSSSSVKHPAPARSRIGWLKQLVAFVGAPTAWAAQVVTSEGISSYACYPKNNPLAAPQWDWLHGALIGITAIAFLIGLTSFALAYTSYRRTRHEHTQDQSKHPLNINEGRTRFLAMISTLASGLFLLSILVTALALLLVTPCHN